ncbi:cadherin-23-like [Physella acuta]|uniref:cadherin-23-like n=1 Tax=Physella acuta TaxID=109671 RepID=UPI0027DD8E64|nr:cadherin-23-like [Physella acuta]
MDIDDNVPTFNHPLYQATVQENTARGVPITISTSIEVVDLDQGANAVFRIKVLKNGAAYGDFDTIPLQGQRIQGRSTITIIVENSSVLDYETIKSITFQISAEALDMSGKVTNTSQATVVLTILDTNDNSPEFPTQPNRFNVSEDVKPGYIVATIVATDRDSEDFGRVVFSLEDDSVDGKFNITSSGVLTVTSPLDREQRSSYSLAIVATDNPSQPESQRRRSRFLVYITVTDVNDNDPKWTQVIPLVNVLESAKVGTPVTEIKATDLDEGLNAKIQYSIAPDTNGSKLFSVKDVNGSAVITTSSSLIDNFGTRLLRVVAMDMGTPPRNASVDISIFVVDENQHPPVFIHPKQSLFNATAGILPEVSVFEEQSIGSLVTVLSATDADQGQNGVVSYYLVPTINKDFEYFKLDRMSGNLTSYQRLDREFQEVYEIQVRAEDNGQPAQLSTLLTMRVKLVDIDDNPPVYSAVTMPQMLSVKEENSTAVIGTVLPAQDKDQSPYNVTCYRLYGGDSLASLVLNNSTGRLSLKEKLDREMVQYLDIVIQALPCNTTFVKSEPSSSSSPNSFSITPLPSAYNQSDDSLLWVRVEVEDINDSPPKFIDKTLLTAVLFDAEKNTEVMSLLTSITDADTPVNSKNMFRILSVEPHFNISLPQTSNDDFSLSSTGSLRTNIRFRSDIIGYYGISIEVYDDIKQKDTADVKVFIVANSQRVQLVFNRPTNEVEKIKNDFVRRLSAILGIELVIDKVVTHTLSDGTLDPTKTDAFIHGHDNVTWKIVDATDLSRRFDHNSEVRKLMSESGITEALIVQPVQQVNSDEEWTRTFAIVTAVLSCIILAFLLVIVHLIRMYRHRLRAATTMAYATTKEQELYEHPGTNKYYAAENPLFGKEIKHAVLDDDKTSHNSLDVNAVYAAPQDQTELQAEPDEEQEVVMQIANTTSDSPTHLSGTNPKLKEVLEAYENAAFDSDEYDGSMSQSQLGLSSKHFPDLDEGITRFSNSPGGLPDNFYSTGHNHIEHTEI